MIFLLCVGGGWGLVIKGPAPVSLTHGNPSTLHCKAYNILECKTYHQFTLSYLFDSISKPYTALHCHNVVHCNAFYH